MQTNKTAIIIWSWWQDGKILWDFLQKKDYILIWVDRNKNTYHNTKHDEKNTNILDAIQTKELIKTYLPDEIYYLAAYHHSSQDVVPDDSILFEASQNIHVQWYFNILEAIAKYSPKTKVCYASSCLIYWWSNTQIQNELTLPVPNSIYAITKLQWMYLWNWFAEKYNLQIVNAILYNHESEFRSSKFVSMKVIEWAINISRWIQDKIILWDLSTSVDRWYAWDYVNAMYSLLQKNKTWDYIISSWKLHTIKDLVEIVFGYLELDREKHVQLDTDIIKRKTGILFGDSRKIRNDIDWEPHFDFQNMITHIIKHRI